MQLTADRHAAVQLADDEFSDFVSAEDAPGTSACRASARASTLRTLPSNRCFLILQMLLPVCKPRLTRTNPHTLALESSSESRVAASLLPLHRELVAAAVLLNPLLLLPMSLRPCVLSNVLQQPPSQVRFVAAAQRYAIIKSHRNSLPPLQSGPPQKRESPSASNHSPAVASGVASSKTSPSSQPNVAAPHAAAPEDIALSPILRDTVSPDPPAVSMQDSAQVLARLCFGFFTLLRCQHILQAHLV
jgi:hypothetical protein